MNIQGLVGGQKTLTYFSTIEFLFPAMFVVIIGFVLVYFWKSKQLKFLIAYHKRKYLMELILSCSYYTCLMSITIGKVSHSKNPGNYTTICPKIYFARITIMTVGFTHVSTPTFGLAGEEIQIHIQHVTLQLIENIWHFKL